MADTKISALPVSTVPLAGTEVLPIVQSSATKQVSVANLTAGRSFDALGMTLTSTDASAAAAPLLDLYRDSASPAASDTLGEIEFNGEDSAGNKQAYGLIHASILSPTSTAEQGQLHFETATAGALTEKMIIGTTNLVINEIGAVFNVRIEGDADANLFFTDATNDRIGVGTITPSTKLDVNGLVKISTTMGVGAATPAASGAGITFPASQSASSDANTLDDYEEGTWTPGLGGFTSIAYSTQTGAYTKIGNVVNIVLRISVSGGTRSGADLLVSNLPFTSASQDYSGGSWGFGSGVVASTVGMPQLRINNSDTTVSFLNTAGGVLAGTDLNTATPTIAFSATYRV
jgi:hypothetical protein